MSEPSSFTPASWRAHRRAKASSRVCRSSAGPTGDGWRRRRGRVPAGHFDEKRATVRMAEMIAEHERAARAIEEGERDRRERGAIFRYVAAEWLEYLERERGAGLGIPARARRRGNLAADG